MYRSSLTLAFVVLYSAAAAASDIYVAPGGIYAPSADVYVRPAPAYRQQPYAEPGYGYQQPSYYGTPAPAYRAPASVYGEYGPAYAPQPAYVERAPVYPERYYAQERRYAPDRYYGQDRYYAAGTRLCAGIRAEAAFARALPFARAMRRRLWQVGLLRLKLPALREFVAIAVTTRRMGGAQRYPSPFRARDRWVSLSLYPSYELSAQFPVYPPVGRGPWNWMPHFFAIEACSTATPR